MGTLYALGAPPDDRVFSLSPDVGLALSSDGSCTWRRSGGVLADVIAGDYFPDPVDPARVLALAAPPGDGSLAAAAYASDDGGASFGATPIYAAPAGASLLGVEIARADTRVITLAMSTAGLEPRLVRSRDGGAAWAEIDLAPALGASTVRIIAIDPVDPDVVYLRVMDAGRERLAIVRDGGATITTPVAIADGRLTAFARLASGTILVAGQMTAGADGGQPTGVGWRSIDGGATFQDWAPPGAPRLRALAERAGKLYLAGSNYSDGWALAVSDDEGRTLQPIARYAQVSAVKSCVAAVCLDSCDEQAGRGIWTADTCYPTADAGTDAGTPGPAPSGCGCAAAVPDASWLALIALLVARAFAAHRRRVVVSGKRLRTNVSRLFRTQANDASGLRDPT
jgi:MYXO-CTERM domain-containing protein